MNTACKNFKDIRFFHEDGMKVYRRAVLSKRDVVTADDYVYLRQTTLPIANKIIAIIDLEVLSQDMWKKVKAGDFDGLAKVFNEEDKALEVVIDNIDIITDNESENLVDVEDPKNIDEEVVDTATTPILAVDAVKYEEQPTVAVEVDKELEDITQDTETIEDENEVEESSDEEEVVEAPVENNNHQNNNNSFKKKRRH